MAVISLGQRKQQGVIFLATNFTVCIFPIIGKDYFHHHPFQQYKLMGQNVKRRNYKNLLFELHILKSALQYMKVFLKNYNIKLIN